MTGVNPVSQLHHQQELLAARERERTQHLPRPARIRFAVKTVGAGESRLEGSGKLQFGAFLLEEPSFTWGVQALHRLDPGTLPLCTVTVLNYAKNERGFYTGAELGFIVVSDLNNIRLKFSLTFEASTLRSTVGAGVSSSDAVIQATPVSTFRR